MGQLLAVLVGVVLTLAVLYVLWRPRWAVVLILVMFPLEQLLQGYLGFFRSNGQLLNILIGGLAVFAVATRFMRGERLFSGAWNVSSLMLLLLYALTWISVLWSPSQIAVDAMLFSWPYMVVFFVVTPLLLDDLEDFHRLAVGVMVAGSITAILIMLNPSAQFHGGRLTVDVGNYVGQTRSNPLALATMGGMIALIAVFIRIEKSLPMTILRGVAFVSGLGLAIGSGSRGQVIAAVFVGVAFYPVARRVADIRQFFATTAGYLFLLGAMYVVMQLFIGDWNADRWDLESLTTSTDHRMDASVDFLMAFAESPKHWVFGLGALSFEPLTGIKIGYVHNMIVEVLCELGVVGLAIFSIMAANVVFGGRWMWRRYRDDPTRRATAAVLAALCVYVIILALKQGSLTNGGPVGLLWWIILATIVAREKALAREMAPYETFEPAPESYAGYEWYGEYGDAGGEPGDGYSLPAT